MTPLWITAAPVPLTAAWAVRLPPSTSSSPLLATALKITTPPLPVASIRPALVMVVALQLMSSALAPSPSMIPALSLIRVSAVLPSRPAPEMVLETLTRVSVPVAALNDQVVGVVG